LSSPQQESRPGLTLLLAHCASDFEQTVLGVLEISQRNRDPANLFKPIAFVAPSPITAEVWLERFALAQGIQAGIVADLATSLAWRIAGAILGQDQAVSPLVARKTVWSLVQMPSFKAIQPDMLRRVRLCWQYAQALDRCLTYRPHWIAAWLQGREVESAQVWERSLPIKPGEVIRKLVSAGLTFQRQHPFEQVRQQVSEAVAGSERDKQTLRAMLPVQAVVIAGWNDMPQPVAQLFGVLAGVIPIHAIALDPSEHYWEDARRKPQQDLFAADSEQAGVQAIDPWILGNMGQHQRRQLTLWRALVQQHHGQEVHLEASDSGRGILGGVQRSIQQASLQPLQSLTPMSGVKDDSLAFHQAIGPWRQVEVMAGRLQSLLTSEPHLKLEDIAILCVNPQAYIPALQAVMQAQGWPLAWRGVAPSVDEGSAAENLIHYIAELASLTDTRVLAQALTQVQWHEVLGIGVAEMDVLSQGFRSLGYMALEQALEALVVGMTQGSPGSGGLPLLRVHDQWVLPANRLDPAVVRKMVLILQKVIQDSAALGESDLTASQWLGLSLRTAQAIASSLEMPRVGQDDAQAWNRQAQWAQVLSSLQDVEVRQEDLPLDLPMNREVWLWCLQTLIVKPTKGTQRGVGLQVASFGELRGLAYQVIVVLGAQDGMLPALNGADPFDPLVADPQLGDPDIVADQRGAFLDVLLAAQHACWLFWSPRELHSRDAIAPAVPVVELQEFLDENIAGITDRCTCIHPLMPVAPQPLLDSTHMLDAFSKHDRDPAKAPITSLPVAQLAGDLAEPVAHWWRTHMEVGWYRSWEERNSPWAEVDDKEPGLRAAIVQAWALSGPGATPLPVSQTALSEWPLLRHPLANRSVQAQTLKLLRNVDQRLATHSRTRSTALTAGASVIIGSVRLSAPALLNLDSRDGQPAWLHLGGLERSRATAMIEAWCAHHIHAVASNSGFAESLLLDGQECWLMESDEQQSRLELQWAVSRWVELGENLSCASFQVWWAGAQEQDSQKRFASLQAMWSERPRNKAESGSGTSERPSKREFPEFRYLHPEVSLEQISANSEELYSRIIHAWTKL
jgi:hypothetical protein